MCAWEKKIIISRQFSIERKVYKQRRTHKRRLRRWKQQTFSKLQPSLQVWKDTKSVSLLYKILPNLSKEVKSEIKIPSKFSFYESHDKCLEMFSELVTSLQSNVSELTLDFSECEDISVSAISLLYILLRDYRTANNNRKQKKFATKISIIVPKKKEDLRVLKYLKIFEIYDLKGFTQEDGELLKLNVLSGKFSNSFS